MAERLRAYGFSPVACEEPGALRARLDAGARVLVATAEALAAWAAEAVHEALAAWPPSPALPVVLVLPRGGTLGDVRRVEEALGPSALVTALERPLRTVELVSVVCAALRRGAEAGAPREALAAYEAEGAEAPARVFLVEDHGLMRYAYRRLLAGERALVVCGEAAGADDALARIAEERPDVALVDLTLGEGPGGLDLVRRLRERCPEVAVVVVSMHDEALYGERALRAGASAYVMKDRSERELLAAVRAALAGQSFASRDVLDRVIHGRLGARAGSPLQQLSDRELEVFERLGRGHSAREIADALGVERKTVDTYRRRIRRKLGIARAAELVQRAVVWVHEGE